jgi:DNA-binding MarR family transcriptional regulator
MDRGAIAHRSSRLLDRTAPDLPSVGKAAILAFLAGVPDACAVDLATEFDLSLAAAGMRLLRFARAGLVHRTSDPDDGVYFYALTEKGRQRLAYLTGEQH